MKGQVRGRFPVWPFLVGTSRRDESRAPSPHASTIGTRTGTRVKSASRRPAGLVALAPDTCASSGSLAATRAGQVNFGPGQTDRGDVYTHELKIRTTGAFLTLSAALLMAGCSSTVTTAPARVAPTTPAATPTATPTAAAVVSGAVLTPAQVAKLPDGVRAYPMPDGTKVSVVRGEPLLAPVQAAVTATVNVGLPGGIKDGAAAVDVRVARSNALKASLVATGTALGRQVLAVYPVYGFRTSPDKVSRGSGRPPRPRGSSSTPPSRLRQRSRRW